MVTALMICVVSGLVLTDEEKRKSLEMVVGNVVATATKEAEKLKDKQVEQLQASSVTAEGNQIGAEVKTEQVTTVPDGTQSDVVVQDEPQSSAPATEIVDNVYISPSKKTLSTNEIFTVTLQNCDKCSFSISNPALVQVVGGGNNRIQLKTKSVGTVSITAVSDDTGKSYTSVITVI
jgi:hypothetical protein